MSASLERLTAAYAIDERSADLARTAVDRLAPPMHTIGATVLAMRFAKRCVSLAADGEWSALASWADELCERYADVLPANRILDVVADGVARTLEFASPATFGAFAAARPSLDAVLAKSRVRRLMHAPEAVDEIDVIVDGLLARLDQSDVLTAEHSRAVSSWCSRLGSRLGLARDEVVRLRRAGMIHDIGKVTTPNAILSAPRGLSDDEFAIMKNHAEAGEAIVLEMPAISHLSPGVRNHHERIDGRGYPDGLRGESIPRIARIVSVADAFNAMIGRRPYRAPFAPSIALERLVAGRGTQFDPDVVDAMVDVVQPRTTS